MRFILFISLALTISSCVKHSKDKMLPIEMNVNEDNALKYLQEIEAESNKDPNVYYQLAKAYVAKGNYTAASEKIDVAIKLEEDNADFFYLKGKVLYELKEAEDGIKVLTMAEAMGVKHRELYRMLASEYQMVGQEALALQAVDRFLSREKTADALTLKGDIYLAQHDTINAVDNYEKATEINSKFELPYRRLTAIYLNKDNIGQATTYINKLLASDSLNIDFIAFKGELKVKVNQYDSAKSIYQFLTKQRDNKQDWYYLAKSYYELNQYDSAEMMAAEALRKDAELIDAKMVIARAQDKRKHYQDAIDTYESILKQDSTYNLASTELDILKRKVAYLWRMEQARKINDSIQSSAPPLIRKKEITDN